MTSRRFAFFDVDDTIISVKSMFSFQSFWYDRFDASSKPNYEKKMKELRASVPREVFNREYYRFFAGREVSAVEKCGRDWFQQELKRTSEFFYKNTVRILKDHQAAGDEVVFVSGSFPAVLSPIAESLSVRHVLSTTMEIRDGKYTGMILPPQTIGAGKRDAVLDFLNRMKTSPEICFAYGDDYSDVPMLSAVGHPTAVVGDPELIKFAQAKGWPIVTPSIEKGFEKKVS